MKGLIALIVVLSCLTISNVYGKIKLSDIRVLTMYHGQMTHVRRSQPVPQLECIDGSANCEKIFLPRVIQCKNMGYIEHNIKWKCYADLPSNLRFGKIDVNCEGYDHPNDKYVLMGSCRLRYTLDIHHHIETIQEQSQSDIFLIVKKLGVIMFVVSFVIVFLVCNYSNYMPDDSDDHESITDVRNGFWEGLRDIGLLRYLFAHKASTSETHNNKSFAVKKTNSIIENSSDISRRRCDSTQSSDH